MFRLQLTPRKKNQDKVFIHSRFNPFKGRNNLHWFGQVDIDQLRMLLHFPPSFRSNASFFYQAAFFTSNAPVCLGSPVCFTDLSYSATPPFGYITTWVWNYGDGSPADTVHFPYSPNVCHSYPFAGIFMVTLTVTENYGNTNSCVSNVNVRPKPLANFMESGNCLYQPTSFFDISYTNGGGFITLWQWNFGDGGTTSIQNPVHFFYSAGNYNVKLPITDNYGCSDSIIKVVGIYPASAGGSVSGNATIILGQGTGTMQYRHHIVRSHSDGCTGN